MAILTQTVCLLLLAGLVHSWGFPTVYERRAPLTFVHTSMGGNAGSSSIFDDMNKIMLAMHERFENMVGWPSVPMHMDNFDDEDDDLFNDDDALEAVDNFLGEKSKSHVAVDDSLSIQKQFDAMEPTCTTVTSSPTTVSPRKSRRKQHRTTQTTTCIKELIIDGQKHFFEEISTTDDKGVLIKQSKSYGQVAVDNKANRTMLMNEH